MPGISSLKRSVCTSEIRAFLIPCDLWLEIRRFTFLSHYDFKNKTTKKKNPELSYLCMWFLFVQWTYLLQLTLVEKFYFYMEL